MSDRASADWRTMLIDDAIEKRPEIVITTAVRFDHPSNRVIRAAAKRRNMSPSAFIRRAAVAFALYDLGGEWDEVNADEPGFTAYGRSMGKRPYRPKGHGFGPWRIVRLEKHHDGD